MRQKKQISTTAAPMPAGPYSQGIDTGDFIFVSGQRPIDPITGVLKDGIREQTRQAIKNVENILKEAGCSLSDVVKVTVFLSDISDFDEMNAIYCDMMPKPFPARSTISVGLRNISVEIEAIAKKN